VYRFHREEFYSHGPSFILLIIAILLYKLLVTYYDLQIINETIKEENKESNITNSQIAINILGYHHLLVPLLVVRFKRDKDIF
jgi:hypothetical protein